METLYRILATVTLEFVIIGIIGMACVVASLLLYIARKVIIKYNMDSDGIICSKVLELSAPYVNFFDDVMNRLKIRRRGDFCEEA